MTLVSQIITDAYRELNLIPLGGTPNANQIAEALPRLNSLIMTTVGLEAGDEMTDVNYGGDFDQSEYVTEYIPDNTRLLINATAALTIDADPRPLDGQLMAVVDASGNFATYNVIIDGNGRKIEGADTVTLSTNSQSARWMYRGDTGNWVKIEELEAADTMPFPTEFDDYFSQMLAIRLNPRYGQTMTADMATNIRRWRGALRSRYRRKELNMQTDPGLVNFDDYAYGYNDNFSIGRR